MSRVLGTNDEERKVFSKTFEDLYNFRSSLVHGKGLPESAVYTGHLRQARNFARGVVCWMLNYLGRVAEALSSNAEETLRREDLLRLLDLKPSTRSQISAILGSMPAEFPLAPEWLMR